MPNGHADPNEENPQGEIHADPPFNVDDLDHPDHPDNPEVFLRGYIQHMAELEQELALALRHRFEAVGFTEVELFCNGTQWEFRASRIRKQDCQTSEHVRELVARVLREMHHEVDGGLVVALVVGDRIGAAFRLRRVP